MCFTESFQLVTVLSSSFKPRYSTNFFTPNATLKNVAILNIASFPFPTESCSPEAPKQPYTTNRILKIEHGRSSTNTWCEC